MKSIILKIPKEYCVRTCRPKANSKQQKVEPAGGNVHRKTRRKRPLIRVIKIGQKKNSTRKRSL
jgi:hypothetical protein